MSKYTTIDISTFPFQLSYMKLVISHCIDRTMNAMGSRVICFC